MAEMLPFGYAGFYDVPRFMVLRFRGVTLVLRSPFDESLDEYPDGTYADLDPNHILTESLGLPAGMQLPTGGILDIFGVNTQCEFGVCNGGPMGLVQGSGPDSCETNLRTCLPEFDSVLLIPIKASSITGHSMEMFGQELKNKISYVLHLCPAR